MSAKGTFILEFISRLITIVALLLILGLLDCRECIKTYNETPIVSGTEYNNIAHSIEVEQ